MSLTNDEIAADRILELETDNDILRVENELLQQEVLALKFQLQERFSNPDGVD